MKKLTTADRVIACHKCKANLAENTLRHIPSGGEVIIAADFSDWRNIDEHMHVICPVCGYLIAERACADAPEPDTETEANNGQA